MHGYSLELFTDAAWSYSRIHLELCLVPTLWLGCSRMQPGGIPNSNPLALPAPIPNRNPILRSSSVASLPHRSFFWCFLAAVYPKFFLNSFNIKFIFKFCFILGPPAPCTFPHNGLNLRFEKSEIFLTSAHLLSTEGGDECPLRRRCTISNNSYCSPTVPRKNLGNQIVLKRRSAYTCLFYYTIAINTKKM